MSGGDAKALPVGLDENLRVLKTQEGIGLLAEVTLCWWSRIAVWIKALEKGRVELASPTSVGDRRNSVKHKRAGHLEERCSWAAGKTPEGENPYVAAG
jgi:hypothetical protein